MTPNRRRKNNLPSEVRYLRALFHSSYDAMVFLDSERKIVDCNQAFLDMFQIQPGQVIGKSIIIIHGSQDSYDRYGRAVYPIIKQQGWWRGEWEFRAANNEIVPVEIVTSLITDEEGVPLGYSSILRNIQDRRQREDRDRAQQLFLNNILESLAHPFYVIDAEDYTIRLANSATGVQDAVGRATCYQMTHRRNAPCRSLDHPCPMEEMKKTGKPVTVEHLHFDRQGTPRFYEIHGFPIFDSSGKLAQTIEYALDITDRKKAEEDLRERETRLRLLTNQVPAILWSVDRDLRFTSSSGSGLKALGLEPDQVVGLSLYEYFSTTDSDFPPIAAHRRTLDGHPEVYEQEWQNQYYQVLLEPMYDEAGKITGVIGIGIEITDRRRMERELVNYKNHLEDLVRRRTVELEKEIAEKKAAEATLLESEDRYRKTVEAAPYIFSITRVSDGKFIQVNEFFCKIFEYGKEEVLGRRAIDLGLYVNPEDRERLINALQNREGVDRLEIQFRTKKGRVIDTLFSARPLRLGGEDCLVAVVVDITQRKKEQAEREEMIRNLRQAQKMEALGTLAGGIAHDFNNILTVILGNAELAQIGLPHTSPTHSSLENIVEAGLHAKELVKQILNFSRKSPVEKKTLKLGSLLKEALKLFRASLPTTIEIRQMIYCQRDIILADPTQIYQVLLNLCTNALQAMRDRGGILEVELSETTPDRKRAGIDPPLKPGNYVKLVIRDNGTGMTEETLKRVFEPYYTTREKGVGTGLGMAVTQAIVLDHGGDIRIESQIGVGTTVTVLFPMIEAEAKDSSSLLGTPPQGNETILLVDDEEWIVDLGQRMLQHLGYRVTGMTASLAALDYFESHAAEIDLVITDLTMPNLTGDKLAKKMLQRKPDLPIILLTGFTEMMTEEKVRSSGIQALAFKPIVMNELAALIRRVLDTKDFD